MRDVKQHCIDCSDDDYVYSHKHVITIENVQEAIHKLKFGKSECVDSMLSDNLIHGSDGTNRLFQYIACLFTAMLCHGITHTGFLLSKLVPIPKKIKEEINVTQTTIGRLLFVVYCKKYLILLF